MTVFAMRCPSGQHAGELATFGGRVIVGTEKQLRALLPSWEPVELPADDPRGTMTVHEWALPALVWNDEAGDWMRNPEQLITH